MENARYHQANLVEETVGRMADIFPFPATIAEAPVYAQEPVQTANASIANNIQQSLLAQMQQMRAMMLQLQTNQQSRNSGVQEGNNPLPPVQRVRWTR